MNGLKLSLVGLATLLSMLTSALTLSAAPAMASLGFPFIPPPLTGEGAPRLFFGGEAFNIAIDEKANKDILVTVGDGEVEVLDTTGKYLTTLTGSSTPAGSFGTFSVRVAVHDVTGRVYVTDIVHRVVDVLELKPVEREGKATVEEIYLGQLEGVPLTQPVNITVNQASGEVYVVDGKGGLSPVVDVFSAAGVFEPEKQITEARLLPGDTSFEGELGSIAINETTGDVFLIAGASVDVFDASSEYLTTWTGENTLAHSFLLLNGAGKLSVATNNETGFVFVADGYHSVVDVFDSTDVSRESFKGSLTGPLGEPFPLPGPEASGLLSVMVDQISGDEYLLANFAGHQDVVDVFGPPEPLPTVTSGMPSAIRTNSATLNGTVNPEGRDAHSIQFEYVKEPAYREAVEKGIAEKKQGDPYVSGLTIPGSPGDAGSGMNEVAVSAGIEGLLPGAEYHYRLAASSAAGTEYSRDQRLITAPMLDTKPASVISPFAATLHGEVDSGTVPTSYHFVYGTSNAYGSTIPTLDIGLPLGSGKNLLAQELTGLQAGETYHFAVIASSAAGSFTGPDETFTTPAIPAPEVRTGPTSRVTVGEAILTGEINPQGWATSYHFEYGTTTAYGSSWPTVNVSLGAFTSAQPIKVTVENLLPGTIYHYRLVAISGGATSYGADGTFLTSEYPVSAIALAPVSETFKLPSTQRPKARTKPKHKTKKHRRKIKNRHRGRRVRSKSRTAFVKNH